MAVRDVVQAAAGVGGDKLYVEDVFSTYLYTGNGGTQTINNGIDLDGEGGLVWLKNRNGTQYHCLADTIRGPNQLIYTNRTNASGNRPNSLTSFNSNGFSLGSETDTNQTGNTYASWSFRKSPSFFDVVTWTGDGVAGRAIPHNLESAPGFLVVKRTDSADGWHCYHRSLNSGTGNSLIKLESTAGQNPVGQYWWGNGSTFIAPTSTHFTVSADGAINASGGTYVAYVFAHDAGGFGDDGEQNVISCGSFQWSSNTTVDLGWEPQLLLWKSIGSGNWRIFDNSRGWSGNDDVYYSANALFANESSQEGGQNTGVHITSTGFKVANGVDSNEHIYIAIRRPMKTPESGTEVFAPVAYSGTGTNNRIITSSITPDVVLSAFLNVTVDKFFYDRLRGNGTYVLTSPSGEQTDGAANGPQFNKVQTGYQQGTNDSAGFNIASNTYSSYLFKRAPGFMDVVAYTGTGANTTQAHNLGVAPELMIVKKRSAADSWVVYSSEFGGTAAALYLNESYGAPVSTNIAWWNNTDPTASVFSLGYSGAVNQSGQTFIAYLFASCPGVSKVGTYSGTGADINVDCGFSAGARFVLIKRTDSSGDWYVWDSVRGIVAGNDPYLRLNSSAAEVTNTDYIDPLASGFTVTSSAPAALNASGGSYIFLAIA